MTSSTYTASWGSNGTGTTGLTASASLSLLTSGTGKSLTSNWALARGHRKVTSR